MTAGASGRSSRWATFSPRSRSPRRSGLRRGMARKRSARHILPNSAMVGESVPNEPEISVGHIALTVSDVAASTRFYAALGLQPCHEGGGIAILELRGGTHLLLFSRDMGSAIPTVERVDLM